MSLRHTLSCSNYKVPDDHDRQLPPHSHLPPKRVNSPSFMRRVVAHISSSLLLYPSALACFVGHLPAHHENACSSAIPTVHELCFDGRLRYKLKGFAILPLVKIRWVSQNLSLAPCGKVLPVSDNGDGSTAAAAEDFSKISPMKFVGICHGWCIVWHLVVNRVGNIRGCVCVRCIR